MNATDRQFQSPTECAEQLDAWACEQGLAIRATVIREFARERWADDRTDRRLWLKQLREYATIWEFDRG